ncbi:DegT/DnrJ/EryC1/StrS family aminotransferase [Runella salmonicolor]|uniref:Aminotransferase class I/II-fold pyridoxal phosphate-dependent enzyme n=1 Tax=Runella salmonicolor TaxID=2950278 RepID=A0ABT1FMQ9_9BACT|nr:aminotransferase class I/II-fold pyridoxal phosphate-dependent enzyme [Runella salmonicolor]MCP1383048.1 aminotransferase class I/II-fold pyridoxal phosphate-dependent enzyme [Runella salmonicolor]
MNKIWLSSPHLSGHEQKYVQEAFAANWIAPLGPNVDGFERDLCTYVGAGHAAALSSGTAALHLALILLGVGRGDVVLCQSFTFAASANPIVYQGATPVFVDSELDTWNISPDALETAIKSEKAKGKNVKAVIAVHLYGMPAQMREIQEICQLHDIPLIEDAAEALGASYQGKKMGSFGLLNVLSFNGNKIITTSGGGALLSDNEAFIQKARFLATQARDNAPHYQHSEIGYNYRLSNICAGIGRGQMEVIDERVAQRRTNFAFYERELSSIEGITFQPEAEGSFSNRWLSCMVVNPKLTGGITRENIRLALASENIEARPLWKPMHLQPIFQDAPYYGKSISERLFENGLCLPSGSNLTQEELGRVTTGIKKCFS